MQRGVHGRFYDFFEKRGGLWGLVLRQPIYEEDRKDPVDPAAQVGLDPDLLAKFPEGHRHIACLQTQVGYKVDMPGLSGPDVEALLCARRGQASRLGVIPFLVNGCAPRT